MLSTGRKAARAAAAAAEDNPPVPRGPLEDIFIRLDDPADLVRASAACTSFRDIIIADPAFRRRFARLHHPPPLVGFLEFELPATTRPSAIYPRSLHPRPLHRASTPAARAVDVAGAADFTCSFLPDPGSWRIRDASGGRLLLSSRAAADFMDLMVCDPVHRTFVRVPPVPDHLLAEQAHKLAFGWIPFLVPLPDPLPASEKEKEPQQPPLQVVWMLQRENTIIAFVFSSSTKEWLRIPTFYCWCWTREFPLFLSYRFYAHGCFYWTSCEFQSHSALKLDLRTMKFSTIQLPSVTQTLPLGLGKTNFIVEASEGDLGALVLGDYNIDLYCRNSEGNDVGAAADWRHSRTVPLPNDSLEYIIIGAADGYLLLQAYPLAKQARQAHYFSVRKRHAHYFSLKLKTLVFEELRVPFNEQLVFVHLYTSFPPPLSLPSVCNEENTGGGQDQGVTGEETSATT